jgi:hypothetical protein
MPDEQRAIIGRRRRRSRGLSMKTMLFADDSKMADMQHF